MTRKLLVRQGGGGASEVDFLAIATPRKGAPWFDKDAPLFQVGQRFANGEAAMGYFKIVDPAAALSTTGFRTRPWCEVRLTEDASGDELTLGWMRVTANDASRRAPYTGGDQVEHDPQLMDCNLDLRGIPFEAGWHRDAENEGERLNALESAKLNGGSSLADIHRVTTNITVAAIADGHLADMGAGFDLPVTNYPAGTDPSEIIADIAGQAGKIWGVVLHHTGGSTHKCLLYVDADDLTTYTTDVRISDQLADHDPDDPTAPTFAPHWLMGAGREQNMEGVVSGLVSIYNGIDGNERTVFVETGEDDDDWETFVGVYNDDQSETLSPATRRANTILNDRKRPYQTHKVSILVNADQAHLVEAGMAIETKSVVMEPGPNKHDWVWRRVAEKTIEPVADGRYWLHLHLEKPRHTHGAGGGAGQPASTSPKPAPEHEPDPGDSLTKFYNANDVGGDAINWVGILENQAGGAAGTSWYHYKSNSPNVYQTTWAFAAGDQLRVSGYIGCRTSTTGHLALIFTDLPAGSIGSTVTPARILSGPHSLSPTQPHHSHSNEWTLFSAGPLTAPVGTTSVALGRLGGTIDFDEVSVYTVDSGLVENDEAAVDYGDHPHDSPFYLPSDYVIDRFEDVEGQVADIADEQLDAAAHRFDNFIALERLLIYGNRGYNLKDSGNSGTSEPENTLEGFRLCALAGVGIEVDTQQNADGTWVAMHDTTVTRTTTSTGNVSSKTDAQWAALVIDAGFGYNATRHGSTRHPGFLEDIITAAKPYGVPIMLEHKGGDITELATLVDELGVADRTTIVATSDNAALMKGFAPSLTSMVNAPGAIGDVHADWLSWDYNDVTSLSVITATAPQGPHSYVPIGEIVTANEATILPTMYARGIRSWESYMVTEAIAFRDGLVTSSFVETDPVAVAHIADTIDAHDASAISIADAGNYFTATDVEAALQESAVDIAALQSATTSAVDHEHINDVTYSGDGATTAFELPAAPFDEYAVTAYVAGTRTEVTLSGTFLTTMTFGAAPAAAADNIKVDLIAAVV